jgi:5-methyltetrahydrofolate--homocysteine methyltransferase
MDILMTAKKSGTIDPDLGRAPGGRKLPPRKSELDAAAPRVEIPARSDVATDVEVFTPPFLGARVAKGISLDEIAGFVNETALFRNQWQFRPQGGESDEEFKARIRPTLRAELDGAKAQGWLVPAVAWGYFPVNAEGDDLVVWTDDDRTAERARFQFPRQQKAPFHCIADFFRDADSGDADYAGFHVVTVGREAIRSLWEKVLTNAPHFEPEAPLPTLLSGNIALTSTPPKDGSGARAQVVRRQPDGSWLRLLDQPEFSKVSSD